MAHLPNGVSIVKKDQRVDQLIFFLSRVQIGNQIKGCKRGEARFGSPDAYCL